VFDIISFIISFLAKFYNLVSTLWDILLIEVQF
jgi:hypothetical protein